jgi:tetratricopeptide (TPR) repeat protein
MLRVLKLGIVMGALVAAYQVAAVANNSPMPSMPSSSGSGAAMTPEEMARDSYSSGLDHKNKAVKLEEQAEKQSAKDREKTLAKANDEYGKALKDFKKATDLVPGAYQAYNGLGFVYRKTGDSAKSLEMYDKALQLAPGFPDAIEYRGEAYLNLNRLDDAKQAYLTLFGKDRANADSLMQAMTAWVAKHQADPGGIDPSAVSAFDAWIKERTKLASLTADMGLEDHHSIWN